MSRYHLVVRNIGWTCIKSDIASYFKKFGTVHEVKIPVNYATGFNRNIAFLKMSCNKTLVDSILKDYHMVLGNEVTVEMKNGSKKEPDNP